jgi:hypothetical protein
LTSKQDVEETRQTVQPQQGHDAGKLTDTDLVEQERNDLSRVHDQEVEHSEWGGFSEDEYNDWEGCSDDIDRDKEALVRGELNNNPRYLKFNEEAEYSDSEHPSQPGTPCGNDDSRSSPESLGPNHHLSILNKLIQKLVREKRKIQTHDGPFRQVIYAEDSVKQRPRETAC